MKALLLIILLVFSATLQAAELKDVGSLNFENSGAVEAQPHFLRGIGLLHSFGWKQAIAQFRKAQEIDPDFALAYWAESLCYNHPLITERDRQSPIDVLERLGPTLQARLAKAPTAREKGLITAVEALFMGSGSTAERRIAYKNSMRELYDKNAGDDEIAIFYALSLLSAAAASGDDRMRMNILAGSIATRVFQENNDHPGAAHFVIHSFDDPLHAPLALDAALKFAQIAPVVSHARHMPTHIFIQHGMWKKVSASNQSAFEAAKTLWEPGDTVGDMVHALDWGQYGDLQLGNHDRAKLWIKRLEEISEQNGGRSTTTLAKIKARYIIETEQWQEVAFSDESSAAVLLAAGLSAYHLDDMKTLLKVEVIIAAKARSAAKKEKRAYAEGPIPTVITHREIAALVNLVRGNQAQALELLLEGVALTAKLPPPRGTANPLKPVHELYGEVLLKVGQYDKALDIFQASLNRTPNRPRSLLGLARTYAQLGDDKSATDQYRKLASIWKGYDASDLQEAELFLQTVQR